MDTWLLKKLEFKILKLEKVFFNFKIEIDLDKKPIVAD
jgi:hypothetical protein